MSKIRKYGLPAVAVSTAVVAGAWLGPIGLAGATNSESAEKTETTSQDESAEKESNNGRKGHRKAHRQNKIAALEELGLEKDTLKEGFEEGKTLAEIAEANGVSTDELTDALTTAILENIDKRVEEDKIDAEKAAALKEGVAEKVEKRINVTKQERQEKKQAFKGLDAQARQEKLDQLVEEGTIDAEKAEKMAERFAQREAAGEKGERSGKRGHHGSEKSETSVEDASV